MNRSLKEIFYIGLPPTDREIIAREICNKLRKEEPKVRELAFKNLLSNPHIDKKILKELSDNHTEHVFPRSNS